MAESPRIEFLRNIRTIGIGMAVTTSAIWLILFSLHVRPTEEIFIVMITLTWAYADLFAGILFI
jgi:hypothetical protein